MKIQKIVSWLRWTSVSSQPVRASAFARISVLCLLQLLLLAALTVSSTVAQQITTYPPPTLNGASVRVSTHLAETTTNSGCTTGNGTTNTSFDAMENMYAPLAIAVVNITGEFIFVNPSLPPNIFTVSNGVSEAQGTYPPQTAGPASENINGRTNTETQTYALAIQQATLSQKFTDEQIFQSTHHSQSYVHIFTSTYNFPPNVPSGGFELYEVIPIGGPGTSAR